MAKLETEIEIALSPRQVWDVLTDFESFPQWNPLLTVIGEPKLGSKLQVKANSPDGSGGQYEFRVRIVDFEPRQRLAWQGGIPGLLSGRHYWHLSASPQGTYLIHGEDFYGLYVWIQGNQHIQSFRPSYEAMNEALAQYALSYQR